MDRPEEARKQGIFLGIAAALLVVASAAVAFIRFGAHDPARRHSPEAVAQSEWFKSRFGEVTLVTPRTKANAERSSDADARKTDGDPRTESENRVRALFPEVR